MTARQLSIPRPAFTSAITRDLAPSFAAAVSAHPGAASIDIRLAEEQHEAYNAAVRQFVPHVVVVDADAKHPDGNFVEDTCVAVLDVAVISQPGHPSRRGEVASIRKAIESDIKEIKHVYQMDGEAMLDGGDVLFTGAHLFIGLSNRTNPAGAAFLTEKVQNHYPTLSCVTIDLRPQPTLHLKCVVTAPSHNLLIFSDDEPGRFTLSLLPADVRAQYDVIMVPDQVAANVLSFPDGHGGLKGIVLQEGFPASEAILEREVAKRFPGTAIVKLQMSEFIKADGALTCCSLLFA
ncbi:hypothetical protein BCR44DRAFT_43904 [Catenaria anguillulae PL171]|uniref:Uncharacterized protein n=1 Tax=Catenaria anguillulae PL171 TaxID=765915 RepID=A0A1Y2I5Y2_9FUNG|nr:hypothetical protein BCR44DRAFT_43904 [Catenaria anguillulae PL171]